MKTVKSGLVVIAAGLACLSGLAAPPPNVVLVVLDACRADGIDGTRGGVPLMPNLAAFQGVRFTNAVAPGSWTTPSMASLLTCAHVDTHQVHEGTLILPESAETMAEYFKQAGYATMGVQTNSNLTPERGFAQGFDQYIYQVDAKADFVTSQATQLMTETGTPFFLYAHYQEPHVPYYPPETYRTMMGYPDPALTPAEKSIAEDFAPYMLDHLKYHLGINPSLSFPPLSATGREAVRTLYDAELRYNDAQLDILLDNLLFFHPNTIVVVLADHGEHFWEHNSLGHVTTLYEELTHVPLLIRAPGLAPAVVDSVAGTVDTLPTVAALAGLAPRPQWQGRSLFAPRDSAGPAHSCAKSPPPWLRDLEMIRFGGMKLIREYKTGAVELYNLDTDPSESVNLAAAQPDTTALLTEMLHLHLRRNARANGADGQVEASPNVLFEEGTAVTLTGPEGTGHVWFKDGLPVADDAPRVTGAGTAALRISALDPEDAGDYECMASDAALHLNITAPFNLRVAPPDSVPAAGAAALAGMVSGIAAAACGLLRRRAGKQAPGRGGAAGNEA